MDKKTRLELGKLSAEIESMIDRIDEIKVLLEDIADTEREKFDYAPENLQGTDKYSEMEDVADEFDSLEDCFCDAISNLEEIKDSIDNVVSKLPKRERNVRYLMEKMKKAAKEYNLEKLIEK